MSFSNAQGLLCKPELRDSGVSFCGSGAEVVCSLELEATADTVRLGHDPAKKESEQDKKEPDNTDADTERLVENELF